MNEFTPDAEPATEPVVPRASLRKNVAHMTTSQVATWLIGTASAVMVPRFLGPTTLGRLQLANSIWAIAAVFTALGTSMHLQLMISRDRQSGLKLVAPVFAARSAAFLLASFVVAGYVAVSDNGPGFVGIVALCGVSALLGQYADVYIAGYMGLETTATVARVSITSRFVNFVALAIILPLGFGVFAVLGLNIATAIFGLVLIAIPFHRLTRVRFRGSARDIKSVTRASLPFMVVGLALATYRQIDVIVISQVVGSRDVGWYAAADVVAGSLLIPATVILTTAYPTFGRLHAHDPDRLRELVRQVYALLFVAAVPIGLGAAVVGPTFAPLLLGHKFDGTGEALVIIGPVTILTFGTTLFANLALATDRKRFLAVLLVVAAVLTVPLDALLVPWTSHRFDNGAIGGGLSYVVTETMQYVVSLIVVAPYLISRSWAWRSLRVLGAGGVMTLAVWPLRNTFLLVPVAVGAVVYILAVLALRVFDEEERQLIRQVLRRVGLLRSGHGAPPSTQDAG